MKLRSIHRIFLGGLLLPIPFLPLFYALLFSVQEINIHRQMRKALEEKELVSLCIHSSMLNWKRDETELLLPDGRAFDVKTSLREGDTYLLTGLFDEKETALLEKQQQQGEENTRSNKLAGPFTGDLFCDCNAVSLVPPLVQAPVFYTRATALHTLPATVITPPPRIG